MCADPDCSTGWGGGGGGRERAGFCCGVLGFRKAEWLGVSCREKAGREGIAMKEVWEATWNTCPRKFWGSVWQGHDQQSFPVVFN